MAKRPDVDFEGQTSLDKVENQIKEQEVQVKELGKDVLKYSPPAELEPQTKLSQSQIEKSKDIYIKPKTKIGSKEPFNEKFRADYEFAKEYVHITAENIEIIGESLNFWTKKFPGTAAEEWMIPVNTPVWVPRYVAEQIKDCKYHRFEMKNTVTDSSSMGSMYGSMAVEKTIQRLDAHPVSKRKSVFMGAVGF